MRPLSRMTTKSQRAKITRKKKKKKTVLSVFSEALCPARKKRIISHIYILCPQILSSMVKGLFEPITV